MSHQRPAKALRKAGLGEGSMVWASAVGEKGTHPGKETKRHTSLKTKTRSLDTLPTTVTGKGLLEWKPDFCQPTQGQRQHTRVSRQLAASAAALRHLALVSIGRAAQDTYREVRQNAHCCRGCWSR